MKKNIMYAEACPKIRWKFNVKIFPKSVEHIFYLYIDLKFLIDIFPSRSISNAPTTDPKVPGSTLAVGIFLFQMYLFF